MTRAVWAVPAILAMGMIAISACSSTPASDQPPPVAGDPPVVLSASAFPKMTSVASAVDVDTMTSEVVHPDELRSVLGDAGFASGSQRSFGGGTGAFSRVLARGLSFETDAGAAAFVEWFGDHAPEEIITADRIFPHGVPEGAVVFRHEPDGCCHQDVPVYLAAWQRGSTVRFLHVGGRRATTPAFVRLIATYDEEG